MRFDYSSRFLPGDLVVVTRKELGYSYSYGDLGTFGLFPGIILIMISEQEEFEHGIDGYSTVFSPTHNTIMSVLCTSLTHLDTSNAKLGQR